MIEYVKDMFVIGSKITTLPYTLKGPIAIVSKTNKYTSIRCPAWGCGKIIVKADEQYVYVQSDIKGRIDVFDEHGDKVKEIKTEDLK